jgi:hypothetical protein
VAVSGRCRLTHVGLLMLASCARGKGRRVLFREVYGTGVVCSVYVLDCRCHEAGMSCALIEGDASAVAQECGARCQMVNGVDKHDSGVGCPADVSIASKAKASILWRVYATAAVLCNSVVWQCYAAMPHAYSQPQCSPPLTSAAQTRAKTKARRTKEEHCPCLNRTPNI